MLRTKIKKLLAAIMVVAILLPYTSEVMAAFEAITPSTDRTKLTVSILHPGGPESSGTLDSTFASNYDSGARHYTFSNGTSQKTIFKIKQQDDDRFQDTLYCLKESKNFTSGVQIDYFNKGDFFDSSDPDVSSLGYSEANYRAIVWLINNMYLKRINNDKDTFIRKVFADRITAYTAPTSNPRYTEEQAVNLIKSIITDDDIEIAQQLAIWNFTDGYSATAGTIRLGDRPYTDIDQSNGGARRDFVVDLYNYLVAGATNATSTPVSTTSKTYPTLAMDSSSLTCEVENSYYKVGPFRVNNGNATSGYTISLKDGTNTINPTLYKIKIEGESDFTTSRIDQIFDKNYYVYIPTNSGITTVQLAIDYTELLSLNANLWLSEISNTQPVLSITGEKHEPQRAGININPAKADLALRKYIISVTGAEGTRTINRSNNSAKNEPIVDVSPLINGEDTAIYKWQKNPVEISIGDKVVFEIRVYNEGQF